MLDILLDICFRPSVNTGYSAYLILGPSLLSGFCNDMDQTLMCLKTKRKKKTSNVLTVRDNTFSGASTARTRTSSYGYSDTSKLNNGAHSALGKGT